MDSNMAGFLFNSSALELESMYRNVKKDDGFIDLGLSLKTLHPQACHPIDHGSQSLDLDSTIVAGGYNELMQWPYLNPLNLKKNPLPNSKGSNQEEDCGEELEMEGVQSRERWVYVKVNMDGVIVGRKICLVHVSGFSSLALQLEDMFGRLSGSGLHLFQAGSEFILFYKDGEENWRPAGDVPWKNFVDSVKRIRIVRKSNLIIS